MMEHLFYMKLALKEAKRSLITEDVPIGALIIEDGKIISKAHNEVERRKDPTAHAELLAISKAIKKKGTKFLTNCILYSTVEPCSMCAGAIVLSRIKVVVFGANDEKAGAGGSVLNILSNPKLNHRVQIVKGVLKDECVELIKNFFQRLRKENERKSK